MKILITTGIFPPDIGGPATYVSKIAQGFVKQGHDVEAITYSDKKMMDEKDYGVSRVVRSSNLLWRYLKYTFTVFIKSAWADVIYVQDSVSAGLPTILGNCLWRTPIVLKVVGDFAWEQAQNQFGVQDDLDSFQHQKYDSKIEFWRKIEHRVASKASMIITPSQYLKKIVLCWGEPEKKIKVIYNAFDEPDYIDESVEMPQGDIIFTAGRLVPWKGMDTLIKIMPRLLKENDSFKLLIIGDGPERSNLEGLVKEFGLEEKVILKGLQPREKLLGYLKKSDIFVLNSSYEGLSHQILEAMWCNVPMAVSRVGGNPEVVEHEKSGLLFSYNNEDEMIEIVLKIYRSDELKQGFVRQSQEKLNIFSFNKMIDTTINTLKSAI